MKDKQSIGAIVIAIILSILLMFVCTSCKKVQYIQGETITKEVRIVERDTTIVTKADSASLTALLSCDSAYNVVLGDLEMSEGERINLEWRLEMTQRNGRNMAALNVDCKEDSLAQQIALRDSVISTLHERNIVEYVRQRNGYDRFVSWGFWILLIKDLLIIAAWALKKFYIK